MYTCKNCGAEVSANMKFCGTCGTPVERTDTPVTETAAASGSLKAGASAAKLRKFIIPAIIIVAVVVAGIAAFNMFMPSKYETAKGVVYIWQDEDNVVVEPNGKGRTQIEGKLASQFRSFDGTKALVMINESGSETYGADSEGFALYYVSDKVALITDGVYDARLSLSGGGAAFTKEVDYNTGECELYLWDGAKTVTVTDAMSVNHGYCLSPDGKIVAFVTADSGDYSGALYNGKFVALGSDVQPVAVADGAKYVYYNKNSTFYVMKGTDTSAKQKLGDDVYTHFFNKDLSQVVYAGGGKSYISRNGGDKQPLSGVVSYFLAPGGALNRDNVLGVASFADTLFYNDSNGITRINGKFETESVVKNVAGAYLADDGKTVVYKKNDSLYKVDASKTNAETVKLVDGGVASFVAVDDGSAVYYANDDGELYYQKGTGKPVLVGDYAQDGNLAVFKGKTLYYISDGELYVSSGAKGKLVSQFDDKVISVGAGTYAITVQTTDGTDRYTYRSTDGKTWELTATYSGY
jgi:hypothetical protein